MKRFSGMGLAGAIAILALGGTAPEVQAADMLQAGFAYGGWGGPMGAGPAMAYTGYTGYTSATGGYVGGGGWGYAGSCCQDIWAGYCNEGGCGGCRVRHRCRPLGCGAGPCCQPSCCEAAPSCGSLAPCGRGRFYRRCCNALVAACAPGMGCDSGHGDMGVGHGYEEGVISGDYIDVAPAAPNKDEAPAPAPEVLDEPAPEAKSDSAT